MRPSPRAALPAAALALLLPLVLVAPARAAAPAAADVTSPLEARRVDRVPTPQLHWATCHRTAQCASVELPLDYDQPDGPTTTVALLRVRARDQAHRLGSLFVNPGGPGGSATEIALQAPSFLDDQLLDRFDVVGMDPRGIGEGDRVQCFPDEASQAAVLQPLLGDGFPVTAVQEARTVAAAGALGRACGTTGRPLSAAMSTAEVARDMDVVRRAVGDRRLTYLGFSYGSYLGQVYGNLFPDRFRALTIDGVLDPLAWRGGPATWTVPSTERLRSGEGADKALREILRRCQAVGRPTCAFAGGDPVGKLAELAQRLKAHPLDVPVPGGTLRFTYADLVGGMLGTLYAPDGYLSLVDTLAQLYALTDPSATPSPADLTAVAGRLAAARAPRDNSTETFSAVLCADGVQPVSAAAWPAAADRAERAAPYFGRIWTWSSVQCASRTWTAQDEDAYTGPFTARTAAPVLVVGDTYDPATNYQGAVTAARLLPHSSLLSSDSWGHTAYGTSDCVTRTISDYLVTGRAAAGGTRCRGDVQPFEQRAAVRVPGAGSPAPLPHAVGAGAW